jgi:hypothetical protein
VLRQSSCRRRSRLGGRRAGHYGAGFTRYLAQESETVVEVMRAKLRHGELERRDAVERSPGRKRMLDVC